MKQHIARRSADLIGAFGPFPGIASIHGLTWDGHRVWFGSDTGLHALDPADGSLLRSYAMPADAGTAFDGRHLYQIAENGIRKIDPDSGAILSTLPLPGDGGASGMAWAEGSLWIGRYRERKIHQVDPETGAVLRVIASDRFVTGVTWVEGELWHGIWEGEESALRRIDPDSGAVLDQLDLPADGGGVSGLESDGADRFFCGGGPSGRVRVVRRPRRAGR